MGRYGAVTIKIGTAGWSIPREIAGEFPAAGSSLERYAARFSVAEINSSFHRPHRRSTWERWRDSVPPAFRFSVKLPKAITHQHKLVGSAQALDAFTEQARVLEEKLAVLLVQLPPKLAFDEAVAASFFAELRARTPAQIACEPRHPSWFAPAPDALLAELGVARVAADPAVCEEAAAPAGWKPLSYTRLHGSPVMYRSSYGDRIAAYAERLKREAAGGQDVWCIFDNTASSAATGDALALISSCRCSCRPPRAKRCSSSS
jgi:uncharacterized protein YecE (DUF72 family)